MVFKAAEITTFLLRSRFKTKCLSTKSSTKSAFNISIVFMSQKI